MKAGSTAVADIRPDFADVLVRLMDEKGMTNQQLAEKVNVARISIVYYRNNYRKPRPNVLQRIANALGVSMKEFLI
jgi:transcriptional regulator with XRE-family HTH domain